MAVKSRYNLSACPAEGEHLLYNTASGRLALLDDQTWKAYEASDPTACPQLVEWGFLQDDGFDELAVVRAGFEAERNSDEKLCITLAPTYACNFACAYCYEQDKAAAKSRMSHEVIEAIYAFVQERYDAMHFSTLMVEWYGGDPSLCLDIIAEVSKHFIAWSEALGITFEAMILTNGNIIGDEEARLLWDSHVRSAYVTIDGPRAVHDFRRPTAKGTGSYDNIKKAIASLQRVGIIVDVAMNADKVNLALLPELNAELEADLGVRAMPVKLNDYAHSYGSGRFSAPHFELYTHEEYARASFDQMRKMGFAPGQIASQLAPCLRFCYGQVNSYFVIDAFGDVYKCDGWMGDKSRSIFNILTDSPVLDAITFDPFSDKKCETCELLPLCMGNCSWERERCGWPCHPLKHTYADYLCTWRSEFDASCEGATLLA